MLASPLRFMALSAALLVPAPALAQKVAKPPASAESQDQARSKAKEGLKLYEANRFAEAYAAFREADTLFHAPTIAIYLARCQRKLGKLLEARATYEVILAEELPKDASAAFVKAHVDAGKELTDLKPRIPSLRVDVTGAPAGTARITLDEAAVSGEKHDVDPGVRLLRIEAPGSQPFTRQLKIDEGAHESIVVELRPTSAQPEPQVMPLPVPSSVQVNRVPAIVALSIGGASAVAGGVLGGLAIAQAGEVKSNCGGAPPCKPAAGFTRPELEGQANAAAAKALGANIAVGVAVAGLATGIVLYVLKVPKAAPASSAVGPRGLTLRF